MLTSPQASTRSKLNQYVAMANSNEASEASNALALVTALRSSKKHGNRTSSSSSPPCDEGTKIGIASQNKLSQLPKKVQWVINSLSITEFNLLRAAISRYSQTQSFRLYKEV
jgi:hypothetical protein